MARIQNAELIAAIRKRYGVRGVDGPDTLAPEIVPVSVVDVLSEKAVAEVPVIGGQSVTGGGATNANVGCLTTHQDKLLRIDTVLIWSVAATGYVTLRVGTLPGTVAAVQKFHRDYRRTGVMLVTTNMLEVENSTDSASVATSTEIMFLNLLQNESLWLRDLNIILPANTRLIVRASTVNTQLHVGFFGALLNKADYPEPPGV